VPRTLSLPGKCSTIELHSQPEVITASKDSAKLARSELDLRKTSGSRTELTRVMRQSISPSCAYRVLLDM
jgi:hypothetical protein